MDKHNLIGIFAIILFTLTTTIHSQSTPQTAVDSFFIALESHDAESIVAAFAPEGRLFTMNFKGEYREEPIENFAQYLMTMKEHKIDEKINYSVTHSDEFIAHVWMNYIFSFDGTEVHYGSNSFQLIKIKDAWKVLQIVDTRFPMRLYPESQDETTAVSAVMNNWHKAASDADFDAYFGKMSASSIFIGTDPEERWGKQEFMDFSRPHFEKGKAWDFKTIDRNVQFFSDNDNAHHALVDELLDTWMGKCRSTAVLRKIEGKWMIDYYHLSIAVPNDVTKEYLRLIEK